MVLKDGAHVSLVMIAQSPHREGETSKATVAREGLSFELGLQS